MLTKFLWLGKTVNLTGDNINISSSNFNVDKNGNMSCKNATMDSANIVGGRIVLNSGEYNNFIIGNPNNIDADYTRMNGHAIEMHCEHTDTSARIDPRNSQMYISNSNGRTYIYPTGITTPKVTQTSLATEKKNFEKYIDSALDKIKNIDIYKYNLKSEEDTDKKHIGFVIGKDYKYSKEVTSTDNQGVDNYSFTSLCCKAIQEQQELIEQLQEEIKKLKEEK